jgi:UDP-3-O-[3-hydroxymyristoyl] N-acetylglucosamine deacetylase
VNRVRYRAQQTLAGPAEVRGIGFITGADIRLRFLPAPANSGVVFARTDLGPKALIPARLEMVTGTQRRTTLGSPPVTVGLVEHVLAALAGLHIDNCLVEINAPEPPGLDGSAWGFVAALRQAGTRLLPARRAVWKPTASIVVRQPGATLALHPTPEDDLRISYLLNYGTLSPICPQRRSATMTPQSFANELASCRTFLLEEEAHMLRQQGLGARTTLADLVVFGPRGPMGNKLHWADEPARHKILDIIGDLSLLGHDLAGHVVAYRSGHPLNIDLGRAVSQYISGSEKRQLVA